MKLRAINQSRWIIDDNPLYVRNRVQTIQSIETRSHVEMVFETDRNSNSPSLKADSDNTSHIYEDLDNIPRILDKSNFPEPFVDAESEQCSDAESDDSQQSLNAEIEQSKDILWHIYIYLNQFIIHFDDSY